jgi:hypothetical protein
MKQRKTSKLGLASTDSLKFLAAAACLFLWPSGPVLGAAQTPHVSQTADTQTSIDQSLKTIASVASKQAQPSPATSYERPCLQGQDDRKSDLCAQWKAADKAGEGVRWAMWQTILSALGIAGLIYSLHLTRGALKAATTTASDSAKATEAAIASVKLAEKSLDGIERPFLAFVPDAETEGGCEEQTYSFANYGRTPCVIVGCDVRYVPITPLHAPDPIRPRLLQAAITPDWNVVPHGGTTAPETVELGAPIVVGAENAEMWMLHGYAIYRSLTGDFFESGFGLYKQGKEGSWKALTIAAFNYDDRVKSGARRKDRRLLLKITAGKERQEDEQGDGR